ncbi:hypothetical protein CONLIGDRAFT_630375 [Coniochaeta ligniaria NRRL 30616]|uniref:DNA repair protein Rad26 n=1 Tax=Coniochaeta ligniaria NRRL 30616 TaxID=1408157 RepID=A0A1J7IYD0_9PEZI|nr:hypothetical protein CONLIGDRAFT_630375 [Coniochaeta ligniaria NRRL 30616]
MDDFSDDDFDDLNDTVLQELENNAIQFTQAQQFGQSQAAPPAPHARPPPPGVAPPRLASSGYDFSGFEADDLDDTVVIDELAKEPAAAPQPVVDRPLPPQQPRVVPGVGQPRPTWQQQAAPSNFNTSAGLTSQQLPSRPVPQPLPSQRHSAWPAAPQSRPVPAQSQFNRRPPPPPPQIGRQIPPHHAQQSAVPRAPGGAGNQTEIIAALQAQLSTLQSELTSAKGEAAIVRSKYENFQTSHEAEIARLKRLNAEQLAKQERAVEAALAAEKNATTELHFVRQDLKEELGRAKVVKRKDELTTTPKKKNKTWAVADGFDEVEILPSPGKGQGKRRGDPGHVAVPLAERTPTKGKRKRPAVDSPVTALEVHSEDVLMPDAPEATKGQRKDTERTSEKAKHRADALPFDFLKLVLDHSPAHGQPLTFDLFSRYAFPSDPGQSLAAIILDKLPDLGKSLDGSPDDPLRLLVDFSELLLVLWTQCNEEKYYTPIYDIVSLLSYTLQLNTMAIVPHLISNLLPLIQTTCLLITIPRTESANGDLSTHPNRALRQMVLEINVTQLLSLLYLAALGCMGPSPNGDTADQTEGDNTPLRFQTQFWRHVQLEFLLMLFDKNHPEEDFLGVLTLLCTSVLPNSIGPIYNASLSLLPPDFDRPNDQTPEFVARSLIDRVSHQLSEPPAWAPRRSVKECRVRLAVLKTLLAFARSPFGALQLAASASLIPRLVLVLCWAIDNLYDMDVPQSILKWKPARGKKNQVDGDRSMTQRGDDSEAHIGDPDATQDMPDVDGPGAEEPQGPKDVHRPENDAIDPEVLASQTRSTDKTLLLNQLIAQITALLHFLITDPRTSNVANMPAKLAASHGGSHRYLITLARLAFAEEDLVLEAGISARTVELAHDLLELAVTPDEGEGVGEVFGP